MKSSLVVGGLLLVLGCGGHGLGPPDAERPISPNSLNCRKAVQTHFDSCGWTCTIEEWYEPEQLGPRAYRVSQVTLADRGHYSYLRDPHIWEFDSGHAIRVRFWRDRGLDRRSAHDITYFVDEGQVVEAFPTEAIFLKEP